MSSFEGKWKLDKSENFEEYMGELGLNLLLRKAAAAVKPTLTVTINGNKWCCKQESTFKNTVLDFVLDEEFDEVTPDGRKMKSICRVVDGKKLVHTQTHTKEGDKDSVLERWIEGDRLISTFACGNVVARREYVRA